MDNYDDVLGQLRAHGLLVDDLATDTAKPTRVRVDGLGKERKGWYWISQFPTTDTEGNPKHLLVGSFGIWQGDDNGAIKIKLPKSNGKSLTAAERKAIDAHNKKKQAEQKRLIDVQQRRASDYATQVWRAYIPDGESDYLARKGVAAHGVRFDPRGAGTIAIPASDSRGKIHGLQIIRSKPRPERPLEKEFFPRGLAVTGHYHLIGGVTHLLLIAEGYATAATIHEATGLPVAVAYNANNLQPVAENLAKTYPRAKILICADDDYIQKCTACGQKTEVSESACQHCGQPHKKGNAGIRQAKLAAFAVNGEWTIPEFPGGRGGEKLTDFNDLYQFPGGGQHLVRSQIESAITRAGWQKALDSVRKSSAEPKSPVKNRQRALSIMDLDDAVTRFAPIDDGTGKFLFDFWTRKIVHKEQMQSILDAQVKWDDVKRHPTWRNRGAYYIDQIGFDPTEADQTVELNTWTGWQMEPQEGSCQRILDTLYYLCSGEGREKATEIYHYLLQWMAYPLQHPGAKMSTAVIMHGPQGTGKSAVFQSLAEIYGDYSTVLNQRGLEDKFNADWIDSKLFILAEEVVTRQEMWHIKNELKELVTGKWVRVNPKNVAAYRQRNQINIAYLSNEGQPLPIDNDDRRHLVVWTPPQNDEEFYDALWQEIDNGGIEAFYHYLLNMDLSGFHPKKRPPTTRAKKDLIEVSKDSVQQFLEDWIDGETDYPFLPCMSQHLYSAYQRWARDNGIKFPRPAAQFSNHIKHKDGWKVRPENMYTNLHYTEPTKKRTVIPDHQTLASKGVEPPPALTRSQWITQCVIEFSQAMHGGNN